MRVVDDKVKIVMTHHYPGRNGFNVQEDATWRLPAASPETIRAILSGWSKRLEQYFKDHPEATAQDKKELIRKIDAMMKDYDAWYKDRQKG